VRLFSRYSGPFLIVLCAAFLIAQVLARPAVGLANNGDFSKMAGPFRLGPEDGSWETREEFAEFIYRFTRADRFSYNREFATAEFLSSEFFLIKVAGGLQRLFYPGPRFDIRWLGGVGAAFFLLAIGIWIYALPSPWRIVAGLFVVLIWTDVAYVQYLNTFYMDTPALIFLVMCVAAALHFVKNRQSRLFALLMVLACILFATSKPQHGVAAFVFVPLFLAFAFWSRDRVVRVVLIAGAVVSVGGAMFVVERIGPDWGTRNVYNVVFMHITPNSANPVRTLEDLGLGRDELPLVGTYAYMENSPIQQNPEWTRAFSERCTYGTLVRYYLLHPLATAHVVYQQLKVFGPQMRPWGNRAREDGFTGRAQASHFAYWSDLRSYLFTHAPWYVFVLAFAVTLGALWLLFGTPEDRAFAALVLAVQLIAALECASAVLADGVETERHLLLFHVATDITILLIAPLMLRVWKLAGHQANRPAQTA
jgi:hypothetical protein